MVFLAFGYLKQKKSYRKKKHEKKPFFVQSYPVWRYAVLVYLAAMRLNQPKHRAISTWRCRYRTGLTNPNLVGDDSKYRPGYPQVPPSPTQIQIK